MFRLFMLLILQFGYLFAIETILIGNDDLIIIYNFIIYLIVRVRAYLYYLAYVILVIIYQGAYFGYLKILNIEPFIISVLMISTGLGFIIFAAFFIKELFQLKKYLPKIDKLFSLILWYLITLMSLYLLSIDIGAFYSNQVMFNMISVAMPIYVSLLLYALNYLAYKKVNKVAFLYSIIWNIISLLGLLLIAMHSGFISTSLGVDYLFEVGILMESILFSLILAYRIKENKEEKQTQQLMLVQQNKLASMGEIISTIAHQWRQPLSQINGCVLGLDMDYRKKILTDKNMEAYLLEIEKTTANMSNIINDFMNFFNSNKKLESFWISELISESKRIVLMSSVKKVEITSSSNDVFLTGYKSELRQALLIVINNGIDAYYGEGLGEGVAKINIKVKEVNRLLAKLNFKPSYSYQN